MEIYRNVHSQIPSIVFVNPQRYCLFNFQIGRVDFIKLFGDSVDMVPDSAHERMMDNLIEDQQLSILGNEKAKEEEIDELVILYYFIEFGSFFKMDAHWKE